MQIPLTFLWLATEHSTSSEPSSSSSHQGAYQASPHNGRRYSSHEHGQGVSSLSPGCLPSKPGWQIRCRSTRRQFWQRPKAYWRGGQATAQTQTQVVHVTHQGLHNHEHRRIADVLHKNTNLFTWQPSNMLGIHPSIICHKLAICP